MPASAVRATAAAGPSSAASENTKPTAVARHGRVLPSPSAARGAGSTRPTFASARRCHEQFDAVSPTNGAHSLAVRGPTARRWLSSARRAGTASAARASAPMTARGGSGSGGVVGGGISGLRLAHVKRRLHEWLMVNAHFRDVKWWLQIANGSGALLGRRRPLLPPHDGIGSRARRGTAGDRTAGHKRPRHAPHHATGRPSRKNPPVGPSSPSRTAQVTLAAPSATGRPPAPPMSVATHPGQTAFTSTRSDRSSAARIRVRALSAAFETLYAGVPALMSASDPLPLDTLTIRGRGLWRRSGRSASAV